MNTKHFESKASREPATWGRVLLALLGVTGLALAAPTPAAAQSEAACLLRGTSMAQSIVAPPKGGDNDFFSSSGGPPNLIWILDTSGSMKHMPVYPDSDGCGFTGYDSLGYDPVAHDPASNPYPDFDGKTTGSDGLPDSGQVGLYDPLEVYLCDRDDSSVRCQESGETSAKVADVCGTNTTCSTCLTTKGFWRRDSDHIFYMGNFMNIYPPKYVAARKALKDVVRETKAVRMSVLGLNGDSGAKWLTASDPDPGCNNAWPPDKSSFYNNRSSILSKINALAKGDFDNRTPLAEALLDAGQFLGFGDDFFVANGWTIDSNFTSDNNTSSDIKWSICWECQQSNAVLITDGAPYDDNDGIPWAISNLSTPCPSVGGGSCGSNLLHKVAHAFNTSDINLYHAEAQTMTTYTVSFALDDADADTLLSATADAGGGFYVKADNTAALVAGLQSVVDDVVSRSISFTTSSFSGVQSTSSQSILLPRLIPDKGVPWKGELYRFDFLSEFVADIDLNNDGKKDQFFLVDKDCSNVDWPNVTSPPASCKPVESDPVLGLFWKKTGGSCGRLGWCDDSDLSNAPAVPHWEAGDRLKAKTANNRRIYTVIDSATGQDGIIDASDPVIPFTETNAADLLPYLDLTTATCTDIATRHGHPAFADLEACAKAVIRFVRGRKLDDSGDRNYLLSDIFHSSPVVVEPPTPFGLLNTPFRNPQSMVTLGVDNEFQSDPGTTNAYAEFAKDYRARDRVAVFGSNGGMIHAVNVGNCTSNCGTGDIKSPEYDRGNGNELWAFIPPDMLPKLKFFVISADHHLFVDGAPWVKNIWVDGLVGGADYQRQKGEFVTLGIFNERRGGVHRTALDLTELDDPSYVPKFLWTFPPIDATGSSSAVGLQIVNAGETWGDTLPAPAPIGPIRYEDTGSPASHDGTNFTERWIVAFGAGYDQLNLRGRGWYMLDAYTGEVLWDFTHQDGAAIKGELHFSFAAAPALTAWGNANTRTYNNPYFDTLVVGDTGGQLWSGRFADPDPTKWVGARVFKENASTSSISGRNPFFSIVWFSVLEESSLLRANVGTGNRHHLRDSGGGECGFDNLYACNRMGCSVSIDPDSPIVGPYGMTHVDWILNADGSWGKDHHQDFQLSSGKSACTDGVFARANIDLECPGVPSGTTKFTTDGLYDCDNSSCTTTPTGFDVGAIKCADQSTWPKNRFYSIRVFGGTRTPYNDASSAAAYDSSMLSNGTTPSTNIVEANTFAVGSLSPGWYYEYPVLEERTATGAVGGGACIIWGSLQAAPPPSCSGKGGNACGLGGGNIAYMYFRNAVTGKVGCVDNTGTGWDATEGRQNMGSDPKPPPPPQVIVQASSTGQVKSSVATAEGGGVDVGQGDSLFQSYTVIEVPTDTHNVRHAAEVEAP
ncbi:MAG: hypothetical protein P1V51_11170 [Deltaproteobacteria bacterium]|nr:hypothetical protein [Deltaproteobacteria bacterium]